MQHDAIAVIDFGGQYAHLIATKVRVRECWRKSASRKIRSRNSSGFQGIVVSGSPSLASHGEDSDYTRAIYDLVSADTRPVLRAPGDREAVRWRSRARRSPVGSRRRAPDRRASAIQRTRADRAGVDESLRQRYRRRSRRSGTRLERHDGWRARSPILGDRVRLAASVRIPVSTPKSTTPFTATR